MTVETAISGTGNPMSGPSPPSIHPYKRHLMQSQNFSFGDSGYGAADIRSSSPAQQYDSSPVLSERPTSEYGSALSLHNPSETNQNRQSKWLQSLGAPPSQYEQQTQNNSVPSSRGSTDDVQRLSSAPSISPILRPSSNNSNSSNFNKRKSRSVDLSHMYLLNSSMDTQLTSTNESVADLSHQLISRYLGESNNSSLVPRSKTIEMYRENVKKSKDVNVLFQYAQYMLQTALTMDLTDEAAKVEDSSVSQEDLKKRFLKEAQHYLKKLSVKGYVDAQYLLGDVYASGALGKIENKESFMLFQAAAKHGHVESAYRTAYCFEEGLGTTRDSRKALDFLKFAASRNHPSAMYKLGLYCFYGRMGLPTDFNTKQNGIKWLSRAAARANELTCAAPYELAKIYEQGFLDIVIPDQKYAMDLYIQSASLGYRPAATLLGQIYETGNETVPQDTSLSVHYYTQAALKGDPVAMLGLCAWYLLGAEPAFTKDESEAFQWALRAAQQGYPKGQFTLGYFYEKGKGCELNMESAWKWYQKAADNRDLRAINKMKQYEPLNDASNPNTSSSTIFSKRNMNHKKNSKSVSTVNLFKSKSYENDLTSVCSPKLEQTGMFTTNQDVPQKHSNHIKTLPRSNSPSMTLSLDAQKKSDSVPVATLDENIGKGTDGPAKSTKIGSSMTSSAKKNKPNKEKKDCIVM